MPPKSFSNLVKHVKILQAQSKHCCIQSGPIQHLTRPSEFETKLVQTPSKQETTVIVPIKTFIDRTVLAGLTTFRS